MSLSYCEASLGDAWLRPHHDTIHGRPEEHEARLFEYLSWEIMQAGLNWRLVLQRAAGMREALAAYDLDRIADWSDADRAALQHDRRLIRNRLKIEALQWNARRFLSFRPLFPGGMAGWLAAHHPRSLPAWVALFRQNFKFTGPEIVREYLEGIGYLPGAHAPDCPVYADILKLRPPWSTSGLEASRAGSGAGVSSGSGGP